jgi:hypothetical protein
MGHGLAAVEMIRPPGGGFSSCLETQRGGTGAEQSNGEVELALVAIDEGIEKTR